MIIEVGSKKTDRGSPLPTGADAPSVVGVTFGEWHHVAATHDGTTRKIFVDFEVVKQDEHALEYAAGELGADQEFV